MQLITHDEVGLIFEKHILEGETRYVTIMGRKGEMSDEHRKELLLKAIATGRFGKELSGLLVRHGVPPSCGYYPLNLVFATPEKRMATAVSNYKQPPGEFWVSKTQEAVMLAIVSRKS